MKMNVRFRSHNSSIFFGGIQPINLKFNIYICLDLSNVVWNMLTTSDYLEISNFLEQRTVKLRAVKSIRKIPDFSPAW